MSKIKFTSLEQHKKIGQEVKRIKAFVIDLSVFLDRTYGKSHHLSKRTIKIEKHLVQLQSDLDSLFAQEHKKDFDPSIYYHVQNESMSSGVFENRETK